MRKSTSCGGASILLVMQQHHSSKTADSICHEYLDSMKKPHLLHRISKRFFDLFFSFVGIVIISPVFLAVLILQWMTTPGTPFFKQERIGKGGKPFHIIKFRTMELNAEADGPQLVNTTNSTRFTRCGQFLRKHHLDELPQLWNVLVGEMSFVGYRPERAYFIKQIMERDNRYALLYTTRPGITSEAAIYNGYTDTIDKMLRRLEMDLDYQNHLSLWTDLKIIFATAVVFFTGRQDASQNS